MGQKNMWQIFVTKKSRLDHSNVCVYIRKIRVIAGCGYSANAARENIRIKAECEHEYLRMCCGWSRTLDFPTYWTLPAGWVHDLIVAWTDNDNKDNNIIILTTVGILYPFKRFIRPWEKGTAVRRLALTIFPNHQLYKILRCHSSPPKCPQI